MRIEIAFELALINVLSYLEFNIISFKKKNVYSLLGYFLIADEIFIMVLSVIKY